MKNKVKKRKKIHY